MTKPLLSHLTDVASRMILPSDLLLFLDFDGTLAPTVIDAGAAQLPPETRNILDSLASSKRICVAIISGRSLSDLRNRVALQGLIYSGNHGLEISGPGLHFVEPASAERLPVLERISTDLRERFKHVPGVWVENKRLTASVHFRAAPPASRDDIRQAVGSALQENDFYVTAGVQTFDIRPKVDWNKGMAVRWIQEASGHRSALPAYIGDDTTDEDAFDALRGGITVRIGHSRETAAEYHLDHQRQVQEFLIWLAALEASVPRKAFCQNEA